MNVCWLQSAHQSEEVAVNDCLDWRVLFFPLRLSLSRSDRKSMHAKAGMWHSTSHLASTAAIVLETDSVYLAKPESLDLAVI